MLHGVTDLREGRAPRGAEIEWSNGGHAKHTTIVASTGAPSFGDREPSFTSKITAMTSATQARIVAVCGMGSVSWELRETERTSDEAR